MSSPEPATSSTDDQTTKRKDNSQDLLFLLGCIKHGQKTQFDFKAVGESLNSTVDAVCIRYSRLLKRHGIDGSTKSKPTSESGNTKDASSKKKAAPKTPRKKRKVDKNDTTDAEKGENETEMDN